MTDLHFSPDPDRPGLYLWTWGTDSGHVARSYASAWAASVDGQQYGGRGRSRREAIETALEVNR